MTPSPFTHTHTVGLISFLAAKSAEVKERGMGRNENKNKLNSSSSPGCRPPDETSLVSCKSRIHFEWGEREEGRERERKKEIIVARRSPEKSSLISVSSSTLLLLLLPNGCGGSGFACNKIMIASIGMAGGGSTHSLFSPLILPTLS